MGKNTGFSGVISDSFFESMTAAPTTAKKDRKKETAERSKAAPSIGRGRPRHGTDKATSGKEVYQTSVRFVLEQYKMIEEIRRREGNSVKDELYLLLDEGITRWCKSKGISREELLEQAERNW